MPDEVIDGAGGLVEAEGFERLGDGGERALALARDPAIDVSLAEAGSKLGARRQPLISVNRAAFHSLVAKLR